MCIWPTSACVRLPSFRSMMTRQRNLRWNSSKSTRYQVWSMRKRRCRPMRSEEHTSELQSQSNLVCRLLLEKKKNTKDLQSTRLNSTHTQITYAAFCLKKTHTACPKYARTHARRQIPQAPATSTTAADASRTCT